MWCKAKALTLVEVQQQQQWARHTQLKCFHLPLNLHKRIRPYLSLMDQSRRAALLLVPQIQHCLRPSRVCGIGRKESRNSAGISPTAAAFSSPAAFFPFFFFENPPAANGRLEGIDWDEREKRGGIEFHMEARLIFLFLLGEASCSTWHVRVVLMLRSASYSIKYQMGSIIVLCLEKKRA